VRLAALEIDFASELNFAVEPTERGHPLTSLRHCDFCSSEFDLIVIPIPCSGRYNHPNVSINGKLGTMPRKLLRIKIKDDVKSTTTNNKLGMIVIGQDIMEHPLCLDK